MSRKPELVVKANAIVGEGPFWDGKENLLYWVDIANKKVHIHDPRAGTNREMAVGQLIGSAVLRDISTASAPQMIVGLEDGLFFLDLTSGKLTPIVDPEADKPGNRFNDGKCDALGRFWTGTQPSDGKGGATEERGVCALYRLDKGHTAKKMIGGVSISNGIAWSSDNKTMYYVDSRVMGVTAFDFDLETGDIRNRRQVIEIPPGHGAPDGMTIDDEGMLYVAEWDGYQVSKWSPKSGKLVDSITFPIAKITSCCFGGPKLNELYVTTACMGVKPDDDAQRDAGSVFRIPMDVSGAPSFRYAG
jgi:sugar lactone lactonase YvrE